MNLLLSPDNRPLTPGDFRTLIFCDALAFTEGLPVTELSRVVNPDHVQPGADWLYSEWEHTAPELRPDLYCLRIDTSGKQIPGTVQQITWEELNGIVAMLYGVRSTSQLMAALSERLEAPELNQWGEPQVDWYEHQSMG